MLLALLRTLLLLFPAMLSLAAYSQAPSLAELKEKAEQGHGLAQFNLGVMYENGRGVAQDDTEAVRWYRAAAEQGLALAQHNLGFMYQYGRGVTQDDREAVRWYRGRSRAGEC